MAMIEGSHSHVKSDFKVYVVFKTGDITFTVKNEGSPRGAFMSIKF